MNPCIEIYKASGESVRYGNDSGICRITGISSVGIKFTDWVKKTFNDYDSLYSGDIISNEAAFCFDEASSIVQSKTGKDKLQRFRTYSHIVSNGVWHCLTKANKRDIFKLICDGAELVCLTDTGQKHILFKHKDGMWQLDDLFVKPDITLLKELHFNMCELMNLKFSQTEIITGNYLSGRIVKAGVSLWNKHECTHKTVLQTLRIH